MISAGPCLQGATRLRRTFCYLLFTVLLFCVLLSAVNCLLGLVSCWLCVLLWAWKESFYHRLAGVPRFLWGHTTDLFLTFFSCLFRTPSWRPCWSHWMPFWSLLAAILCPFWLPRATKMKSEMHLHLQQAKPLNLHIVAHFSLFLWSPRLSKTSQNRAEKPKEDTKKRGNESLTLCRPVVFQF